MKHKNNEQIFFDMLEEVATESIAEERNAYTYVEIDDCYGESKVIAEKAKKKLNHHMGETKGHKKLPPKQEYRFYTFGNCCLIVIRCRKSYFLMQIYGEVFD